MKQPIFLKLKTIFGNGLSKTTAKKVKYGWVCIRKLLEKQE